MSTKDSAGFQNSGTDANEVELPTTVIGAVGTVQEVCDAAPSAPRWCGCTRRASSNSNADSSASREVIKDWSVIDDPHNLATRLVVVADGAEDKSDD